MIDAESENLIGLTEATQDRRLCRNGKAVHIATIWRWAAAGRLETIHVGGRTFTSTESITRMLAKDNGVKPSALTSPREREKQLNQIERRLAASGI